ncbi:MAG: hypothetical protein PVG78_12725 [Desulfobacterales bacterium]
MENRYLNIVSAIRAAEEALVEARQMREDALQTVAEVEPELEKTKRLLRKALLAKNQDEIARLEKEKAEVEQQRRRLRLRVESADRKVKTVESDLKGLRSEKNEIFGDLLRTWLKSETQKYDTAATEAMLRKERITLAHHLAKQRGLAYISSAEIGPALAYLPKVGLPVLKDFDSTSGHVPRSASATIAEIEKEILEADR